METFNGGFEQGGLNKETKKDIRDAYREEQQELLDKKQVVVDEIAELSLQQAGGDAFTGEDVIKEKENILRGIDGEIAVVEEKLKQLYEEEMDDFENDLDKESA